MSNEYYKYLEKIGFKKVFILFLISVFLFGFLTGHQIGVYNEYNRITDIIDKNSKTSKLFSINHNLYAIEKANVTSIVSYYRINGKLPIINCSMVLK